MRRTNCGGCGLSHSLEVFLDLGLSPLADRFPQTFADHEDRFRIDVAVCQNCWLVQLMEIVPDDILWSDYEFYSSGSPTLVEYHKQYAEWVLQRCPEQAKQLIVEIASNDGNLLQHFHKAGCRTLGVDPAKGPCEVAQDRDLQVLDECFTRSVAAEIKGLFGSAGIIIANNVVAHVADLEDLFGGIADLLSDDGVAIIEVQAFEDLWLGNQIDHFYHEHRYYFSQHSLQDVLARHGLVVESRMRTLMQGGSHRVMVRRGTSSPGQSSWLSDISQYKVMQKRADLLSSRLRDALEREVNAGHSIAGYAASAKSTTLLNFCGIDYRDLEYVVDMTPSKIGKLTPGTHVPVVGPGMRPEPDVYLLLAWNYLSGILRRERSFVSNGGRFLVPIPTPSII